MAMCLLNILVDIKGLENKMVASILYKQFKLGE
jgi:hypothetical protein